MNLFNHPGYVKWILFALPAILLVTAADSGHADIMPRLDLREHYGNAFDPVIDQEEACRGWTTLAKLHACLQRNAEIDPDPEEGSEDEFVEVDSLPAPFRMLAVKLGMDRDFYLLEEGDERVRLIAFLGGQYEPGAFGIHETFRISAVRRGRAANRDYLWIETVHHRGDSDMGINEYESLEREEVRVVFMDGHPPILRFPLRLAYERNSLLERPAGKTSKPPIVREVILDAQLSDDGILKISLVRGNVDELPGLAGSHRVL